MKPARKPSVILTIGHSNRSWEEFLDLLKAHHVKLLVDVRKMPGSRKNPQFDRDTLSQALHDAGIDYLHLPGLGGLRRRVANSPNAGWKNTSFQGYADYMLTPEFEQAIGELLEQAARSRTAYMCAERVYFRCHRMLVSDWLVAHGHEVFHIDAEKSAKPHKLMAEARIIDGRLIYRGDRLL